MGKLMRSIKGCMSDLKFGQDNILRADFIFPADFLGFKGHFPGKPILPGVCKIQAVLLMLEESKQKDVLLKEIVQAKFFSPVSCNEKITFNLEEKLEPQEDVSVKALVTGKDKKIAEIHLKVTIIDK
jgi:3-hydroxyacyl-[acyl-carrier-protein] dehydratase